MTDFFVSHAAFGAWLAFLQWSGFSVVVWVWLGRTTVFLRMGLLPILALGVAVGMVVNFQMFFLCVVLLKLPAVYGVLAAPPLCLLVFWILTGRIVAPNAAASCGDELRLFGLEPIRGVASQTIAGLAVAAMLVVFVRALAADIPGVFWAWDAVVSWNRWATEWYENTPPIYTVGYPQLLPSALAGLYTWLGSPQVEPVARLFMLVFPVGTCLLFLDGWRRWHQPAFLWGMAAWLALLVFVFPGAADSGYVDVPVAFFVALTGYLLLLGCTGQVPAFFSLVVSALAAAAAVLTKQPGGIAWLLWLAVVASPSAWRGAQLPPIGWTRMRLQAAGLFMLLAAPWYLYVAWNIITGTDVTNLGYLTSTIHAGRSLPERMAHAFTGPLAQALSGVGPLAVVGSAIVLALALACRQRLGRVLVWGITVPHLCLWAALFSYDVRNIMPIMAVFALALGLGASMLAVGLVRIFPTTITARIGHFLPLRVPDLTLGACLLVLTAGTAMAPVSVGRVEALQTQLQLRNQDAVLNAWLVNYAHSPGFDGEVTTTYSPMVMIEELKVHVGSLKANPNAPAAFQVAMREGRPFCELQALWPTVKQVKYLLLHEFILQPVIEQGLRDGVLKLLFAHGGVRFMQIACPA